MENSSDNLKQQIVNISKAGAYDILCKQMDELLAENQMLKVQLESAQKLNKTYFDFIEKEALHIRGMLEYIKFLTTKTKQ